MFLTCILSENIVLTIMYFKISDTNRGKKSLFTMVIVIELMLYSKAAVIFLGGVQIRNVKVV